MAFGTKLAAGAGFFAVLTFAGYAAGTAGAKQIGALGLLACLLLAPLLLASPATRTRRLRAMATALAGASVFAAVGFVAGEAMLRIYFHDGTSFSSRFGPIVARFERDFQYNGFDGPSRGPAYGPDANDAWRIMVQGDSITWGQGVRAESELYPALLLAALRAGGCHVEMAVLSRPGREIDGHLEQLRKQGSALRPDLLVYQWYWNDMESDRGMRPGNPPRVWRRLFFHPFLASHSYFWFFLDFAADRLLPGRGAGYADYLNNTFLGDTPEWNEFAQRFELWAAEARRYAKRTVVLIVPDLSLAPVSPALYEKVAGLARAEGLEALDLNTALAGLIADPAAARASPFDNHPSPALHRKISAALDTYLQPDRPCDGQNASGPPAGA